MTNFEFFKENPDEFGKKILDLVADCSAFPKIQVDEFTFHREVKNLMNSMSAERIEKEHPDRTLVVNVAFVYNIPDNIESIDEIYKPFVTSALASALNKTIIPYFDNPENVVTKPDDITFGATQYFEFGDDSE